MSEKWSEVVSVVVVIVIGISRFQALVSEGRVFLKILIPLLHRVIQYLRDGKRGRRWIISQRL